jgi:hypothetical protein
MNKAQVVFEKIATSDRKIYLSELGSKKLVDDLTNSRKKYNSFQEKHKQFKTYMRKLKQRDFFESVAKNLLNKQESAGIFKNLLKVRLP